MKGEWLNGYRHGEGIMTEKDDNTKEFVVRKY
jgi:hypothetical protein